MADRSIRDGWWVAGAFVVSAVAFAVAGLWPWAAFIVALGAVLGAAEWVCVRTYDLTLSQIMWRLKEGHPRTAWALIAVLGAAFAVVIAHLAG